MRNFTLVNGSVLVFSKKKKLSRVNILDFFVVENAVMTHYLKFIKYTDMYTREPMVTVVHVQAQWAE